MTIVECNGISWTGWVNPHQPMKSRKCSFLKSTTQLTSSKLVYSDWEMTDNKLVSLLRTILVWNGPITRFHLILLLKAMSYLIWSKLSQLYQKYFKNVQSVSNRTMYGNPQLTINIPYSQQKLNLWTQTKILFFMLWSTLSSSVTPKNKIYLRLFI